MTNEEFSNEFDVLVNNFPSMGVDGITNNPADNVFTEYEKSVFLTQAQHSVVVALYNGTLIGESFETTEQQRRFLNELVTTCRLEHVPASQHNVLPDKNICVDYRSQLFLLPLAENGQSDVMFISYEELRPHSDNECIAHKRIEVVPTTQDEMHRVRKDPYRGPNKRRALRLSVSNNMVEVIASEDYPDYEYFIRYIKKPHPIILRDLVVEGDEDDQPLNIEGYTKEHACELDQAIHRTILEKAVSIALASKQISQQMQQQQAAQEQQEKQENNSLL